MKHLLIIILSACTLFACTNRHPEIPLQVAQAESLPQLLPDYSNVTVPCNIAPLNFLIDDVSVSQAIIRLQGNDFDLTYGSVDNRIIIDEEEWHTMLQAQVGDDIDCQLYTQKEGQWYQHPSYKITVSPDSIDTYVSYRLIEPSYVSFENIAICQRNLTSFEESIILDNSSRHREQCINCHSYQNYRTENMLLHIRLNNDLGEKGGTTIVRNGKATHHTDLKRDGMISNPVYPAWHPSLPLIAFSTNKTGQFFHLLDNDKIEVQDTNSALVLYDVDNDKMIPLPSTDNDFDCFPTWSPDGRYLYYTSAHYVQADSTQKLDRDLANHYQEVHYNLYRRTFDAASLSFGEQELVYDLAAQERSASLPRVSPDGKHLIFACGHYGCFHIWHSDADIWMLDLATGETDILAAANSTRAESYPSWSSNGRWIMMASRRDDNNYSRIYMAHYSKDGQIGKAFELPQADPFRNRSQLKSYNRPEFMIEAAQKLQ